MNLRQLLFKYPLLVFLVFGVPACTSPSDQQKIFTLSGATMGTTYTIKLHSPEKKLDGRAVSSAINRLLNEVNRQMSTYLPQSTLSQFNRRPTTNNWYEIPAELCTVIRESMRINALSRGAFDITLAPLVNLWGFGSAGHGDAIPGDRVILEALREVGSHHLAVRETPCAIKKNAPKLTLDLSGIAKGFAVDQIAKYLDEMAVTNYLVEIGGEIGARGLNTRQEFWRIGIEKPLTKNKRALQTIVALHNVGMATSGDYRNYFEKDGRRYSHTLDPTTGKPVTHTLASVTVIHRSTMTADALATALLVLGPERGLQLAMEENLAAFFLIREHDRFVETMTPQFAAYLTDHRATDR